VTKTAPSRRLRPGDLICGLCGEGNPNTRRFCSRCGSSLIEAVRVKESWWRRLLRKILPRRGPKVVKLAPGVSTVADATGRKDAAPAPHLAKPPFDLRRTVRRIFRTVRIVVAAVLLIGGVLYGAYPPARHAINNRVQSLKSRVSNDIGANLSPIHAVNVTGNAVSTGSSPLYAADELLNTYWLAPWSTTSEPVLTLSFAHRVTLKRMILHAGAANVFVQYGRPSQLLLRFSNGESVTIQPQDTAQQQTFSISHADLVSSVEIHVTGIDPGTTGSNVAITEIELFGFSA